MLCAKFCDIWDVFLRMNVAKCAMCGVQDAASLSIFFHLTEGGFFLLRSSFMAFDVEMLADLEPRPRDLLTYLLHGAGSFLSS